MLVEVSESTADFVCGPPPVSILRSTQHKNGESHGAIDFCSLDPNALFR